MHIELKEPLSVGSHTTIDERGVHVVISGSCISIARAENVILHNFEIVSMRQSDAIHVFDSRLVWIDHLVSMAAARGLVSVVQGSTDVTVSNCYFSNGDFIMLWGASD